MTDAKLPELAGLHHIKLPVANLARSLDFYARVFGARRIPEADHHRKQDNELYAYICEIPGLGTKLELRLNPDAADKQRQFDPFTIAAADRTTLRRWADRLDALNIAHSGEIVAIQAWLVVFDDPDQHRLRLYTLETHGAELAPDEDNRWLQS